MSGMTIGLMSLDLMNLKILKESGTPEERKYCSKIIPLVSQHHLLLVTLLLANAAAMESLPIFLDRLVPAYLAIILSVTMILFFGEVIPQAICSKYGLAIGYYIHWAMWGLIAICFVIAYPVAKLLDCILGGHQINFYRVEEIKQLVLFHEYTVKKGGDEGGGPLSGDEVRIIQGALNMREKVCDSSIYTPLEKVFCLPSNTILDRDTIRKIHECGHSRIPVYRKRKTHFIGILLVKDLIIVDPEDKVSLDSFDLVMLPQLTSDTPLYTLLDHFQKGKSHMAVVLSPEDFTTVLGIVTLEDIIEEILNVEILDEADIQRQDVTTGKREIIRFSMDSRPQTETILYRPSLNLPRPSVSLPREGHVPAFKSTKGKSSGGGGGGGGQMDVVTQVANIKDDEKESSSLPMEPSKSKSSKDKESDVQISSSTSEKDIK
eukprot:TRINITY_DN3636_c0_g1_i1.p1 TRINITY_DN3636_c0_g1~~TRINITY_DN3636_c0_g1_i1.p1  ORF type:complete len:444 (-),score=81.92 TRINITY_DN3636_c0_g1_i1:13-1311(-)